MAGGGIKNWLSSKVPLAAKIGLVVLVGGIVIGYLVRQQLAESKRELAIKNAQESFRQRWADGDLVLLLQLKGDEEEMRKMKEAAHLSDARVKEIRSFIKTAQARFQNVYMKSEKLLQGDNLSSEEQKMRIAQALRYSDLQSVIERDLKRNILGCLSAAQREEFVAWLERSWVESSLANWAGP